MSRNRTRKRARFLNGMGEMPWLVALAALVVVHGGAAVWGIATGMAEIFLVLFRRAIE